MLERSRIVVDQLTQPGLELGREFAHVVRLAQGVGRTASARKRGL